MQNTILYIVLGFLIFVLLLNIEHALSSPPRRRPPRSRPRRAAEDETKPQIIADNDDHGDQQRTDVMDDTLQEEEFPLNPKDSFRA